MLCWLGAEAGKTVGGQCNWQIHTAVAFLIKGELGGGGLEGGSRRGEVAFHRKCVLFTERNVDSSWRGFAGEDGAV